MRRLHGMIGFACVFVMITQPTHAGDWTAVSYCKVTGNIGYAYRSENKLAARQLATAACQFGVVRREGKSKKLARSCCQIVESTNSSCFVVSSSIDSRKSVFVARHKSKYKAVTQSMRACMDAGKFCRMLVIACAGSGRGKRESKAVPGYGIGRMFPNSELR